MRHYVILFCFMPILFGCENELEIDPEQGVDVEIALSTENNLSALLVGAYSVLREEGALGGTAQVISDLLGADNQISYQGFFAEPREFLLKEISVANERVSLLWFNYYKVINISNLILDNSDLISSSPEQQARIIGEARFLRAISYLDLIRLFSAKYDPDSNNGQPGIPLRLSGITDYTQDHSLERSSVEAIYDQIQNDLVEAISNLPAENDIFADKYSAMALLARMYLQKGNYQEALNMAHQVITESGHSLVSGYGMAFNNDTDSAEDLFAIQMNAQEAATFFEGTTYLITLYASFDNGGLGGFISLNDEFIDLFDDPADERSSFFYISPNNGLRLTSKYTNKFGNVPVIRLAEMYLIRAEANYRLGTTIGDTPLNDINYIRARAGAVLLGSLDLADILKERQLELAFEGHSIHDLKRTNTNIDGLPINDPRLVLPIPLDELNTNSLIEQNPGY